MKKNIEIVTEFDTVTISSFYFKSKGQLDLKWFLISFLPGVKSLIISR